MDWPYNETPDGIQTRIAQRMGDACRRAPSATW